MKIATLSTFLVLALTGGVAGRAFDVTRKGYELVDMSHNFDNETIYYDAKKHFNISLFFQLKTPEFWVRVNQFHSLEHGGTHMDAPNHFIKDKYSVEQLPISTFFGPAVIINAIDEAKKNVDYEVSIDDLMNWEKKYGKIPKGAIVLLNFNWEVRWPDPQKIFATDANGNHHPGLHKDASKWLIENRPDIHGVGTDCPSLDIGSSNTYPSHLTILKRNIYILENVAKLSKVPNHAIIYAFPMKIRGGTGSPTRILASFSSSAVGTGNTMVVMVMVAVFAWGASRLV